MNTKKEIKYIQSLIEEVRNSDSSFLGLFKSIFKEKDKVMITSYKEEAISYTYGQIEKAIYAAAFDILEVTKSEERGSWIAVHANDKLIWVIAFWATLLAGYKAFLLNPSHLEEVNNQIFANLKIKYVVGDTAFNNLPLISLEIKEKSKEPDLSSFANEIALSSSGTSLTPKVAIYSGERIFENIRNFGYVLNKDERFIKHKGQSHSQLVILPFYHIFGFMLSFVWYSFAHARFVLPKDLSSKSIGPILKKESINMILSIPLFFNLIADRIINAAKEQGKEKKLLSLLSFNNKLQEKMPHFGAWIVRNITAKGLRKKTLGRDAVVLGVGGAILPQTSIKVFNGLGYRLINGYGTTELSIFLAAYGCTIKELNTGTIGKDPWRGEYQFDQSGELSLKLPTCSDYVLENNARRDMDINAFYKTGDIAHLTNGCFYIDAREDDLLVLPNGEKVFPSLVESYFEFLPPNTYRVLSYQGKTVLVIQQDKGQSNEELYRLYLKVKEANKSIPPSLRVQEIRKTLSPLPLSLKQEVSRPLLIKEMDSKIDDFPFISASDAKMSEEIYVDANKLLYIKKEVAHILSIKRIDEINDNDDFFADLGGDSISFMELTSRLNEKGFFAGDKALALANTTIKEIAIQFKMDNIKQKKEEG